jgi:hypothetical protein
MKLPARIESKIQRVPFCGCWLWMGSGGRYGYVWFEGKLRRAHSVVFELSGGSVPEGQELMHTCDIGLCVNPDHLVAGTHQENMTDMVRKGRSRSLSGPDHWSHRNPEKARAIARENIVRTHHSGALNNNAKATPEVVARIRSAHSASPSTSMADLGRLFGLGREQTRKIVKGIVWNS